MTAYNPCNCKVGVKQRIISQYLIARMLHLHAWTTSNCFGIYLSVNTYLQWRRFVIKHFNRNFN